MKFPISAVDYPRAGNMRENGARCLDINCHACRHKALMNIEHMADEVDLVALWPRMACTSCGVIGYADIRPNWKERPQGESLTDVSVDDIRSGRFQR